MTKQSRYAWPVKVGLAEVKDTVRRVAPVNSFTHHPEMKFTATKQRECYEGQNMTNENAREFRKSFAIGQRGIQYLESRLVAAMYQSEPAYYVVAASHSP